MPYLIRKTNGRNLLTIQDGVVDTSTGLNLIGRNVAGYGEYMADNLVRLLENFANDIAPLNPLEGQLWYDTSNKVLNIWNIDSIGGAWVSVATGSTDTTGNRGLIGYTGSRGPTGYAGDNGSIGAAGFTGSVGATGATGPIGYTGSIGLVGYTGSIGVTGAIGYTGSAGATGPIGYTGSGYGTTASVQMASLGVGTPATGVAGEIRTTNNITSYYSDNRLQENITPIRNALAKVMQISGVTYNSNELAETFGYSDKQQQVGVLAQELEVVLPHVVVAAPFDCATGDDGIEYSKSGQHYKTVRYERIIPLLIEAIKEQQHLIAQLTEKLNGI